MPTAGGLDRALANGRAIGCDAVQVFTGSPRQWSHPPMDPETAAKFRAAVAENEIGFTVAHDSYLINLAAPSEEVLVKSRSAFHRELERAECLGIPWVVTHMGASLTSSVDDALSLLIESLKRALEETEGWTAGVALETTAGQGTTLGASFEQLARVLDDVGRPPRLGVCLDTCHIFVAGYDLRDDETYEKTWEEFNRLIGYDTLKVIHANDAKKPLGSRVDRHEHIGDGEIGTWAFTRIMTDHRLQHVPVVVETPDADEMHAENVSRLRRMMSEN
jgi:deoxyribonuclease-4